MDSDKCTAQKEDEMKHRSKEEEEEEEEESSEEEEEEDEKEGRRGEDRVVRDIRRYYCEFCGICRSKKILIAAHVLSHHKDEMVDKKVDDEGQRHLRPTCSECGKSFSKPAYLKQHVQSHSLERPFTCPIDGCHCSYRRKDHLTRHLLTHEGKIFVCPVENCNKSFSVQGNMKRHVEEVHSNDPPLEQRNEQHICPEIGCGKVFKYASKLKKHQDSHVRLDSVEVICTEPGCGKFFSGSECLKEHIQSSHQYIPCEICGSKQLKKNIKRHMRAHKLDGAVNKIKCTERNCQHTFTNKSNLKKHVKAVHLEQRPFACRVNNCELRFAYKHARERHEKLHFRTCTYEDFVESDEHFLSKPRGGRKRKAVTAETLLRKKVVSLDSSSVLDNGNEYLSWLLTGED